MEHLFQLIEEYGVGIAFLNVLLEQLGAPIPAFPTLVIAGSLAKGDNYSPFALLFVAVSAALIADLAWYMAGKLYGRKVMALLCRISLTPDSCIRQTESVYLRYGAPSLMVAKFIPGFASIATALAGSTRTRLLKFFIFDTIGATLWAGLAIYLGQLFSSTIEDLLSVLTALGKWGLILIAGAITAYIAGKWCQRYLLLRSLRMARVSVDEVMQMIKDGIAPTIIDVRPEVTDEGERIPGSIILSLKDVDAFHPDFPPEGEVIVYCACPNEVSAAKVAQLLMRKGYTRVRPLKGGIAAWLAAEQDRLAA